MAWYKLHLVGCNEAVLVDVEADTLDELACYLSVRRFVEVRLVSVDGEAMPRSILIATHRVAMVVEPAE